MVSCELDLPIQTHTIRTQHHDHSAAAAAAAPKPCPAQAVRRVLASAKEMPPLVALRGTTPSAHVVPARVGCAALLGSAARQQGFVEMVSRTWLRGGGQ